MKVTAVLFFLIAQQNGFVWLYYFPTSFLSTILIIIISRDWYIWFIYPLNFKYVLMAVTEGTLGKCWTKCFLVFNAPIILLTFSVNIQPSFSLVWLLYNVIKHLSGILMPSLFRCSFLSSRTTYWLIWNWVCLLQTLWAQLSFSKINLAPLFLNVFLNTNKIRLRLPNSQWAALKKWVIFPSA